MTRQHSLKTLTTLALLSLIPATYQVRFDDLNLDSDAGNERLYSRIRVGADLVCHAYEGRELQQSVKHKRCVEEAIANAVKSLDRPRLTACYLGHNRGRSPLAVAEIRAGNAASTPVTAR
jgi:UrcA family protein